MKLQLNRRDDLVFTDKPAGINTHSVDKNDQGWVEMVSEQIGQKCYVFQRLDQTTSGALAFALTKEKAAEMTTILAEHRAEKVYRFLTDKVSYSESLTVESKIERQGNEIVSLAGTTPNAKTHFQRIKRNAFYELWEARPVTGKPHQVRLHAKEIGLPILGDVLYGGSPYTRICLHALSVKFEGLEPWVCPPPLFFERMGLVKNRNLVELFNQADFRQRAYGFLAEPKECLRIIDRENGLPVDLDLLGEVLWLHRYDSRPFQPKDYDLFQQIHRTLGRPLLLQQRAQRSGASQSELKIEYGEVPNHWQADENGMRFEFRKDSGLSHGLFLDQRDNRQRVRSLSKNLRVLNLFSYTCGFSLAAAIGGARETVSVDASQNYLKWGQRNFELNQIPLRDDTQVRHHFVQKDAMEYLKVATKVKNRFDLIIADPPSFGRSNGVVFQIEKDWRLMIDLCLQSLTPKGRLLFATNFESWDQSQWLKKLKSEFPKTEIVSGDHGLDYSEPYRMKCFWLRLRD